MARTAWLGDAATDEAEPWDEPVPRRDRRRLIWFTPARPARPESLADVPPRALEALTPICGELALDRIFLVPGTFRSVGHGEMVFAPGRVLGFGQTVVAAWIETGPDGLVISSPVAELAAIDDRTILLYGRLRMIGRTTTVAIRYNAAARDMLEASVAWVRARMATPAQAVAPGLVWIDRTHRSDDAATLPYRWRFLLGDRSIRSDVTEPAVVAAGDLTDIVEGGQRPAGGIAVLDSRELVIATEPIDWMGPDRHGVDRLIVPRDRLAGLRWDGRLLTIRLEGVEPEARAEIALPLEPHLVRAMREAIGDLVRWS